MSLMYKIGVLGDKDSVMGFGALGLSLYFAQTAEEAREAFAKMKEENYAIIYVTERLCVQLAEEIAACRDSLIPAVIPIPDHQGTLGIGMENVKKNIERAVGSDIIGD